MIVEAKYLKVKLMKNGDVIVAGEEPKEEIKCLNHVLPFNEPDHALVVKCLTQCGRVKPDANKEFRICMTTCRDFMCKYFISFAYDYYCSNLMIVSKAMGNRNH